MHVFKQVLEKEKESESPQIYKKRSTTVQNKWKKI